MNKTQSLKLQCVEHTVLSFISRTPRQCIKKQIYHCADKGPYSQSYGFSSGYVWMKELDHKKVERQRTDAFRPWC